MEDKEPKTPAEAGTETPETQAQPEAQAQEPAVQAAEPAPSEATEAPVQAEPEAEMTMEQALQGWRST